MHKRNGFTIIELIFVIVVLGILAMVAIPRMSGAIDDAGIAKARSDVAAVRSALASERQSRFLKGDAGYITHLDQGVADNTDGVVIFDGNGSGKLLTYGVITGSNEGQWMKTGDDTYRFKSTEATTTFTYTSGTGSFTCTRGNDANGTLCKRLID